MFVRTFENKTFFLSIGCVSSLLHSFPSVCEDTPSPKHGKKYKCDKRDSRSSHPRLLFVSFSLFPPLPYFWYWQLKQMRNLGFRFLFSFSLESTERRRRRIWEPPLSSSKLLLNFRQQKREHKSPRFTIPCSTEIFMRVTFAAAAAAAWWHVLYDVHRGKINPVNRLQWSASSV